MIDTLIRTTFYHSKTNNAFYACRLDWQLSPTGGKTLEVVEARGPVPVKVIYDDTGSRREHLPEWAAAYLDANPDLGDDPCQNWYCIPAYYRPADQHPPR